MVTCEAEALRMEREAQCFRLGGRLSGSPKRRLPGATDSKTRENGLGECWGGNACEASFTDQIADAAARLVRKGGASACISRTFV